ncbi:hypothetical protein D3C87_1664680 [compost metagenome]
MDAGGTRHLSEPLYGTFDILACHHHKIRHFVDNDDDIGQGLQVEFFRLVHCLAGLAVEAGLHRAGEDFALVDRLLHTAVEAIDVAHTDLRHLLVALLHLAHRPLQRHDGFFRIGNDGGEQMRNTVIDR